MHINFHMECETEMERVYQQRKTNSGSLPSAFLHRLQLFSRFRGNAANFKRYKVLPFSVAGKKSAKQKVSRALVDFSRRAIAFSRNKFICNL